MIKIFLDPGHGGTDSGAVGNGLLEKDVTLDLCKRIKKYLDENYTGHTTKLSRSSDRNLSLKERTDKANKWGAHYFLSIHINSGGGEGYEDYIHSSLSSRSNTAKARSVIHKEIVKFSPNWRDRGEKRANFHVLRESNMPAMLTENGFIDNKKNAEHLKSSSFKNKIAKGHALGLAKVFQLKRRSAADDTMSYRVIAGSFQERENAVAQMEKLKRLGISDVFIDSFKK